MRVVLKLSEVTIYMRDLGGTAQSAHAAGPRAAGYKCDPSQGLNQQDPNQCDPGLPRVEKWKVK